MVGNLFAWFCLFGSGASGKDPRQKRHGEQPQRALDSGARGLSLFFYDVASGQSFA
jgi:hypothetical protein